MARSHPHRQNTIVHQGITYNALASTSPTALPAAPSPTLSPAPPTAATQRHHQLPTAPTYHCRPKDSRKKKPNTRDNRHHPTTTKTRPTTSHEWHARNRRPLKRRPRPAPTPTTSTQSDHHETGQPSDITYDTLTVGRTSAANTHGTIHTTTNPTNDRPRCRHLQHPYRHLYDPGTG